MFPTPSTKQQYSDLIEASSPLAPERSPHSQQNHTSTDPQRKILHRRGTTPDRIGGASKSRKQFLKCNPISGREESQGLVRAVF